MIFHADVCVLGGSCTGVFAAVRAARLGLKAVIVEKLNCLGGTATAGLVNVWHSLLDFDFNEQIIAGLTYEAEQRLISQNAAIIENNNSVGCRFNSARLSCLLDDMVAENNIKLYLHTYYSQAVTDNGKIDSVIISNKDGIGAIKADFFIDASGDGDIARDIGIEKYSYDYLQPPSACFYIQGNTDNCDLYSLITRHGKEFGLDDDWGWSGYIPGIDDLSFRADNHIFGVDCSSADDLTKAETEGRRKARALTDLLKKYYDNKIELASLCSSVGVRDTVHYKTRFCANQFDLLTGRQYDTTVMKGTYRIDVHHQHDNGITFMYLNGATETFYGKSGEAVKGNWRDDLSISGDYKKYYCVPFEILVQEKYANFIAVGRMINADSAAFGALRVMVNLNQLGEAAGVAAAICVDGGMPIQQVDGKKVRELLNIGGSSL